MKGNKEVENVNLWDTYGPIRKLLFLLFLFFYGVFILGFSFAFVDASVYYLLVKLGYANFQLKGIIKYFFLFLEIYYALKSGRSKKKKT